MSDRPATGPTAPFGSTEFKNNPELRSPADVARAAAEAGAVTRRKFFLENYPMSVSFQKLATMNDQPMISAADFKEWNRLRENWDRLYRTIAEHTPAEARKAFESARSELEKALADGTHKPGERDNWTKVDYGEDFAATMKAAKGAQRQVQQQAAAIGARVLKAFSDWLEDFADEIEQKERDEYNRFGVDYRESHLVLTLRSAVVKASSPAFSQNTFNTFVEEIIRGTGAKLKK